MYEYKGFTGIFYKITDWIVTLAGSNLIWIIFNLPLLYLAFCMLFAQNINQLVILGVASLLISPFVFFPATSAMFAVIREWIMEEDIKIIRSFWRYYKENYARSMMGGLLIALMWLILMVDYYYFTTYVADGFIYLFVMLSFFLFVFTLHFFSFTVHVYTKLRETFKNALLLTFGTPLLTLGLGVICALIFYLSFQVITFLVPFFMGSLITYLSFSGFFKFFLKMKSVISE